MMLMMLLMMMILLMMLIKSLKLQGHHFSLLNNAG
jgi:hypothetical protein